MAKPPPRAIVLVALLAMFSVSCGRVAQLVDGLPTLTKRDLAFKLPQSSKIYAADGTLITTLHGVENRTIIPLTRAPRHVVDAIIAIEDERFYEHEGVDLRAVMRAFFANVRSGQIEEGGSTITQQYVKNVIIAPGGEAEKTIERKLVEAALARQLERKLGKDEILDRYINTVYFGAGAYGLQAAARTFFGKPASRLSIAQGALLAGLIRSPEHYNPYKDPKAARARRAVVLDKMVELDMIDSARAARAFRAPLKLRRAADESTYPAAHFIDYALRQIKFDPRFKALGRNWRKREKLLFTGGLRIHTTVDPAAQRAAEAAVDGVLTEPQDPYAGLVAIDPRTGHVKAMVGGRDYFARPKEDKFAKLNLAIAAEPGLGVNGRAPGTGRQAGSAFKPFALAAAIADGIALSKTYKGPSCMTLQIPGSLEPWRPCNYESAAYPSVSLLEATVRSVNTVFAQLILEVGAAEVVGLAADMGIRTPLSPLPSSVLGTNEVNPLGMASAFGTLATNGVHHPPVAVTKIVDGDGRVLYRDRTREAEVLDPAVAYLTTNALEGVIQRGTGVQANIGRPAAGKTGTAQEWRDAWFVGYTPDLVAAVWVGYPDGQIEMKPSCSVRFVGGREVCRPTRIQVTGGSWPAMIWNAFMSSALAGIAASDFAAPSAGFVTVTIDTRNGCLAGKFTPAEARATVTLAQGTEPTRVCREEGDAIEVPDVLGLRVKDAIEALESGGFVVERVDEETDERPPGTVLDQSPAPGALAPPESTVTITVAAAVSEDKAAVPDVVGLPRPQAEARLKAAGFTVRTIVQGRPGVKPNRVWKQDPAGESRAAEGATVAIWVTPG